MSAPRDLTVRSTDNPRLFVVELDGRRFPGTYSRRTICDWLRGHGWAEPAIASLLWMIDGMVCERLWAMPAAVKQ